MVPLQRWTAKRKAELILDLIKGSRSLVDVCREYDLKQSEVESWTETFLKSGEKGLQANAEDEQAAKEAEIKELRAKVGELYLELEFRKKYQALNDQSEMKDEGKFVSISQVCRWYSIPRSTFYYEPKIHEPRKPKLDEALVEMIRGIIQEEPEFGVRRITAVLRNQLMLKVNRKKVRRIIRENNWQVRKKQQGSRPRAKGLRSVATKPNERWAIDCKSVFCGRDGWCFLTAIIDCCDRMIVGWRLSKRGVSKIAAAALEDALRERDIKPGAVHLTIRSDNGLVFGAKPFVKVVNQFNLQQEEITPYCPEQNGMIERWFRSLKEECVWLNS